MPTGPESSESLPQGAPDLEALLEANLPALRAFVRLHLSPAMRTRESCSDIAQSVCREVLQRGLGDFDFHDEQAFKNWLFTWASHKLRDRQKYYGAQKRWAAAPAVPISEAEAAELLQVYRTSASPSGAAEQREHLQILETALDRLNEDHREVIVLCRIAELSREQAAEIMGRKPGAVRALLNRALVRLSTELNHLGVG